MLKHPITESRRAVALTLSLTPVLLAFYGCAPDPIADDVATSSSNVTSGDLTGLALANAGGTACGRNTRAGNSFFSSCTGNGGQPEYWCADFVKWVWANSGVNVGGLTAAAGSFYVYGQNHGTLSRTAHEGDAVVFNYGGNGYADHVAIVTKVLADGRIQTASGDWNGQSGTEAQFSRTSHVILNNPPYPGTVGSHPGVIGMTISGFISPAGGVTGTAATASCAGLGNGGYCGGHDIGGDVNTLYTCGGHSLTATTACASGCTRNPGTVDDACAPPECPGGAGGTGGAIHDKYVALGECRSFLGAPTTGETGTPDGVGRYNVFQNGSIYWTPQTGAFEVHGAIRDKWAALKWEAGELGYPTSDEYAVAGGRRNDFQHGAITFDPVSGQSAVTKK